MPIHLTEIATEHQMAKLRADARRWRAVRDARAALVEKTGANSRARLARRRRVATRGRRQGAPGTTG
jgi:hypothetical protein